MFIQHGFQYLGHLQGDSYEFCFCILKLFIVLTFKKFEYQLVLGTAEG